MATALRHLRRERWSRMLDLAHRVGISVSALSRYERGLREPRGGIRRRLAQALDITEEQLVAHYLNGVPEA